ncbi:unnamed protein product [Staurois parvus]|uniref:Uncharacterized protein n=1 Tax=Staurois parvus TaxID=386267 RepID=A0ABN9DXW0_9NEOB|nr:unnamed protein product [Staurois parvus]
MTERGQHMLKRTVHRSHQLSAELIAKDLQTSCALQISTITVRRELHGFHGGAASSKTYYHVYDPRCAAIFNTPMCAFGLYTYVSEMTNHTFLSGNLKDLSGFDGCQENGTCLTALCPV